MGRRPSGALPQMRRHRPTNTARIVIGGKVHSLGRWGSPEARDRFDTLMAAYLASGRTSLDAGAAVVGRRGVKLPAVEVAPTAQPAVPCPSMRDATGGLTVGELARAWLRDIEATRPNCRRTSLWHGAVAASRAVRPFATMPVAAFGSRALVEVQRHLVNGTVPGPADGDGPPATKQLSRRYINDIVGRVRQMFHWGVLQELVPDDRVKALEIVPALAKGQTTARDNPERKPVRPSVVRATLPYMTAEVADLIWFIRLTGCRPSEAARMRPCRIRDRHKAVWRYVPKRHKTAHKGKQRHVAIGPEAQAIVAAHAAGRGERDYVFTPERSVPRRKPKDGVIPIEPRKPSPRVGKRFTKDSILRCVTRAIIKANAARAEEGLPPLPHWTPYQLRYTRLREIRKAGGREAAQAVAGHSRATMTDHYAPANWGRAARFAAKHG
jgi:integrase